MTSTVKTSSSKETIEFAKAFGAQLSGGEIIELSSDLGGGKTTLVKGLAIGIGSKDTVTSPSFTLQNEYKANGLTIHHFDFYRLSDPGLMQNMLDEVVHDKKAVTIIEWAGLVDNVLPENRIKIELSVKDENEREIIISYPDKYNFRFKE
jgi:tRNA threonylcarbamoyladenosine biosynthesis protein TsaE